MSKLKLSTLANIDDTKSVPVDTVVQGSAKAWVNFNGTGTVAISAAFNVSSITDNGTGDYTVNFTEPLPDAAYAVIANARHTAGGDANSTLVNVSGTSVQTTAGVRVASWFIVAAGAGSNARADFDSCYVTVFR